MPRSRGIAKKGASAPFFLHTPNMHLKPSSLSTLALIVAVLAFMLLGHPYQGVFHDGVLYFGQSLLNAGAPGVARDIFFAGGSQDRYSIYGPLMTTLYGHAGRAVVQSGALLASWLTMMAAVLALLKRLDPTNSLSLWGILAFAVISPIYGGCWILAYTETFATARTFAEPSLLWSLFALLNGRLGLALALQVLAALFHPLLALPVMAITWCFLCLGDRRWLWLLAALPAVLWAAAAGVPPWDGLLKKYPPYWGALVETANHLVQLKNWALRDHLIVFQDLVILIAVARLRPADAWSRLLWAAVVMTVALMALTALGADLLESVLLTQVQPWRVHLVSHLLATMLSPWLAWRLWQLGGAWPLSACALVLSLTNSHIGADYGVPALALWALTSLVAWRGASLSRGLLGLACTCILFCALTLSAEQLYGVTRTLQWQLPDARWIDLAAKVAAFPLVAFAAFAALWRLSQQGTSGSVATLGLGIALLLGAVWTWDQRTDLARAIDDAPEVAPHPFMAHIPTAATVYWPTELAAVWGLLQRASHYSQPQGAGLLFNRDTALMFGPRKDLYRLINEDRERCKTGSLLTRNLSESRRCEVPSLDRLAHLCEQHDAPNFLVLREKLADLSPLSTWALPPHREPPQTFHLYACSQLKSAESP